MTKPVESEPPPNDKDVQVLKPYSICLLSLSMSLMSYRNLPLRSYHVKWGCISSVLFLFFFFCLKCDNFEYNIIMVYNTKYGWFNMTVNIVEVGRVGNCMRRAIRDNGRRKLSYRDEVSALLVCFTFFLEVGFYGRKMLWVDPSFMMISVSQDREFLLFPDFKSSPVCKKYKN